MNVLIPYLHKYRHADPVLEEFSYGDRGTKALSLKHGLRRGDYVFFHTNIGGRKCITAYYVVDRVVDTRIAIKNRNITAKYCNPHITEALSGERSLEQPDVVVFGDPIESRVLNRPLPLDRNLVRDLSTKIRFPKGRTDAQAIGSAIRAIRELTAQDVRILLAAIRRSNASEIQLESMVTTHEVSELLERDLEELIARKPTVIGRDLRLVNRQMHTPVGVIDLVLEGRGGRFWWWR